MISFAIVYNNPDEDKNYYTYIDAESEEEAIEMFKKSHKSMKFLGIERI